ncbi:serine/threonine protein kinase [bacterium]|nr:serine/threonine protein kinase [bacterium]
MSDKLFGKYEIKGKLGQGGMAIVYHAFDPLLQRDVAIKALLPKYKNDPNVVKMFLHEGQLMAKLDNPHIVKVYENAKFKDFFFYVMEYINGKTLKTLLKEGMDTKQIEIIFKEILKSLSYIHKMEIIHLDLKPSNIMVENSGKIKITDFGIGADISGENITTNILAGTIKYIAPEQLNKGDIGYHTDIYQLGVILYEMYSGKLPFQGTKEEIIKTKLEKEPEPLYIENHNVPDYISTVCSKMLRINPTDRYKTVDEILEDMETLKSYETYGNYSNEFEQNTGSFKKLDDSVIYGEKTSKKKIKLGKPIFITLFTLFLLFCILTTTGIFFAEKVKSRSLGNILIKSKTFIMLNSDLFKFDSSHKYAQFLMDSDRFKEAKSLYFSLLGKFPDKKKQLINDLITIFINTDDEKSLNFYLSKYNTLASKSERTFIYVRIARFYKNKKNKIKTQYYFNLAVNNAPNNEIKHAIYKEFK